MKTTTTPRPKNPQKIHSQRLIQWTGAALAFCFASAVAQAQITNDLVVHLTFDNTYNNTRANGIDGTAVGSPTFVTGQVGSGAVALTILRDASTFNYVTLGNPPLLNFGSVKDGTAVDFSIGFWCNYTNQIDDPPFIANKNWSSSGNQGWGIFTQGGGNFRVNVTDDAGTKQDTTSTPTIRDGKWHHVVVTFARQGVASIYVDGAQVSTSPLSQVVGPIDTSLVVNIGEDGTGAYTDGGSAEMVNVFMDDLGIWRRVISPTEVAAIYNAGLGGTNLAQVPAIVNPYVKSTVPGNGDSGVRPNSSVTVVVSDGLNALDTNSVRLLLNGTQVPVTISKKNFDSTIVFTPSGLLDAGSTLATLIFGNTASPQAFFTNTWNFSVASYVAMPTNMALPLTAVDTTKPGFVYRVRQIDSGSFGVLAANVAHAEAQLAGLLVDPVSGTPYPDISTAGEQPDGSYVITNVINFSFDTSAEEGAFTSANNYPDATLPGIGGIDSANVAAEVVTYLELQPGFYTFAVNATDGFRFAVNSNAYDPLGVTLGLFDYRAVTTEQTFGVAVQTAGIYPVRLVWFRVAKGSNNKGDAGLELYTIDQSGSRALVNDLSNTNAVKAYWKRTSSYGTFVKYAGPSAFVSPFGDSADVGFQKATVQISDGTTAKVDPASVVLSVDGAIVATNATAANAVTTVSYTPAGLQLPRTAHTANLVYAETGGGARHTNTWDFHLLRNYVLPTALYTEDFESTPAGPDPSVPTGWVQENHTDPDVNAPGNDTANLNSDFYLGWVVVDKSFNISKDFGLSGYTPQLLNGVAFDEASNPLLTNHYIRAESDVRDGSQVQYLTTKAYDLTGKAGIVIAFDSSYEQNQDALDALEYTVDGNNWNPIFYWLQGDIDNQARAADILRDGLGNIDAVKTMTTTYGDVATYTNAAGTRFGGHFGFFIKAPITQALSPYIEGRYNDDSSESKRIELYRVPLADNQKNVQFRFVQAGTGSWYWAIDNWGIYSVPSLVPPQLGTLGVSLSNGKVVISWTGSGSLQSTADLLGTWTNVPNATSPVTISPTAPRAFYRLSQ
jgi:hypothetical protein